MLWRKRVHYKERSSCTRLWKWCLQALGLTVWLEVKVCQMVKMVWHFL